MMKNCRESEMFFPSAEDDLLAMIQPKKLALVTAGKALV